MFCYEVHLVPSDIKYCSYFISDGTFTSFKNHDLFPSHRFALSITTDAIDLLDTFL